MITLIEGSLKARREADPDSQAPILPQPPQLLGFQAWAGLLYYNQSLKGLKESAERKSLDQRRALISDVCISPCSAVVDSNETFLDSCT